MKDPSNESKIRTRPGRAGTSCCAASSYWISPSAAPRRRLWGGTQGLCLGAMGVLLQGASGCSSTTCSDALDCASVDAAADTRWGTDAASAVGGRDGGSEAAVAAGGAVGVGGGVDSGSAGATGAGGSSAAGGAVGAGGSAGIGGSGGGAGEAEAGVDADAAADGSGPDEGAACDRDASPYTSPCVLSYGVFVSPWGSDTNDGSRGHPFATLAQGLSAAKDGSKRVYVCTQSVDGGAQGSADGSAGSGAEGGIAADFTEAVSLGAALDGMRMYGGFDCTTWQSSGVGVTRVKAGPGAIPLTLTNLSLGVTIEDFAFEASDAASAGASSIAAIVSACENVELRHVTLVAGRGGDGEAGADGTAGADAAAAGDGQRGTGASCPGPGGQLGGYWPATSTCGSRGGAGGTASQGNTGAPGYPGTPITNTTPPNIDNSGARGPTGGDGTAGSPGDPGTAGTAAPTDGSFSSAGYTPAGAGGDGQTSGYSGQGGGGGGASNVPGSAPSTCTGASGGAGGMGGCGGLPGTGGKSGGASVALLSTGSSVTLDGCTLVSSAGGS